MSRPARQSDNADVVMQDVNSTNRAACRRHVLDVMRLRNIRLQRSTDTTILRNDA
jgi:hypothetical protein